MLLKRHLMLTQSVFNLIYAVAFLSYLLLSSFIIYHIVKYSVSKTVMSFTVLLFLIGTFLLLFSNATLFFSVPAEKFTPVFNTTNTSAKTLPYSPHNPF